jgi:PAS domain S-box-containing protein
MHESTPADRIEAMRRRVTILYRSAATRPQRHELLPEAFEELQNALEELQSMNDELHRQHEYLLTSGEQIEAERQSYQDLFTHAPVAYLITNLDGTIRRANLPAVELFQTAEKFMVGRSLALFVPDGARRAFREQLMQLRQADRVLAWEAHMQLWGGRPFVAALTVAVARGPLGHPVEARWVVQDITERTRGEEQTRAHVAELERRIRELSGYPEAASQFERSIEASA